MVFFHDAPNEGQTQPPSPFFGGYPRLKNIPPAIFRDAVPGVGDQHVHIRGGRDDFHGDITLALHGVYPVFHQVFNGPVVERPVEQHRQVLHLRGKAEVDELRAPQPEVLQGLPSFGNQVVRLQPGQGSDLGKTFRDGLQPADVLFDLLGDFRVQCLGFQQLVPPQEGGKGGADLVGGFFGHPGPEPVLLRCLVGLEEKENDGPEEENDEQQGNGVVFELVQHFGVPVIQGGQQFPLVFDADGVVLRPEGGDLPFDYAAIAFSHPGHVVDLVGAVGIDQDHRGAGVELQYLQVQVTQFLLFRKPQQL